MRPPVLVRNRDGNERQIDENDLAKIQKSDPTWKIISLFDGGPYSPKDAPKDTPVKDEPAKATKKDG